MSDTIRTESESMRRKLVNELKVLILSALLILIGQNNGFKISIINAIPGMIVVVIICLAALIIKAYTPKLKFPAFAWALSAGMASGISK